ncbi:MAG: 3-isopropylmalate dehydratase small subunit, partial [Deltaproteobacteria bacterium]|nr:3-isopropylmalate dehydratase small subunit [Deltaproteobacteria bacterium]
MIEKFVPLNTVGVPLDRGNVDTDAIIPARYLKTLKRTGLGVGLFFAWRYDMDGKEQPDFPLNRPS